MGTNQHISDIIDICILSKDGKFFVVLRHHNGSEEISDQSYATEAECRAAIEQYITDIGATRRQ